MMNNNSNNNGRILIVDDEEELRRMLKIYLEHLGYETVVAEDGENALDIFKNNKKKFELVLLDIKMPKIDGHEVLRRIKDDPKLKNISVIMLTTTSEDSEIQKCYELGCSFYMVKPVDYHQFMEAVDSLGKFLSLDSVRLAPKN